MTQIIHRSVINNAGHFPPRSYRPAAQIEAGAIKVNVCDGNEVSLEGKVDCWEEREAVENAAWSVAGVELVDDRLTIVQ